MSAETYRHTQFGWPMLLVLGLALSVPAWILGTAGMYGPLAIVVFVMVATVLALGWLRVTVDDSAVNLQFGVGLIRKRFALSDVQGSRIVKNAWYQGTGIRMIQHGWLYNVAGLYAVELSLAGNSVVRVGTDEPELLLAALQEAAGHPHDATVPSLSDESSFNWRLALVVPILAVVAVMIFLDVRSPVATVDALNLTVHSGTYKSVVALTDITDVAEWDTLPSIAARTNGFRFGAALRGHFRLTSLGNAMLFVDTGYPPYAVIHTRQGVLVVGFKEPAKTRALLTSLARHTGR